MTWLSDHKPLFVVYLSICRSPEGQFYHTRQAVLDQLILENYPQHQIDLVQVRPLVQLILGHAVKGTFTKVCQ